MPTLLFKRLSTTPTTSKTEWAIGDVFLPLSEAIGTGVIATKITYHKNGAPSTVVSRFPNNAVSSIIHKDTEERFHGLCKRFSPNGKLLQTCRYEHGTLIEGRKLPSDFSYGYAWKKSHQVARSMGLI